MRDTLPNGVAAPADSRTQRHHRGMYIIDTSEMSRRRTNLINFGADVKYNNSPVGVCVPGKTSQAIKNVFSVIMYCAREKKREREIEREREVKKRFAAIVERNNNGYNRNLRPTAIIINRLT